MILGKKKYLGKFNWNLNGFPLEVVKNYKYVGLNVAQNGLWNDVKQELCRRASKAVFCLCNNM